MSQNIIEIDAQVEKYWIFFMFRSKLIKSEAVRRLQQFDTHQNLPCSVTVQIPTENIRFSSSKICRNWVTVAVSLSA